MGTVLMKESAGLAAFRAAKKELFYFVMSGSIIIDRAYITDSLFFHYFSGE